MFQTLRFCIITVLTASLSACSVITVVDTAASAVVGVAGLALDTAVGTVKVGGKIIGKAANAALGSSEEQKK